jgi:uridine kinase
LGPGGSRVFRTAAYDVRADHPLAAPLKQAAPNAVLLFDGVFLFRPELAGCWDLRIYLDISFEESLRRALTRDLPVLGSREVIEERYRRRYIPGQKLYLAACCPRDTADWVIDHELPETPALIAAQK